MADVNKPIDPAWAWDVYKPSDKAPWDVRRVGHLYRRAAFGATAAELDAGVADGPEKAVGRLMKGGDAKAQADYDDVSDQMARSISQSNNGAQLRAWWVHRMLYSPHPLQEKMTLFWHNHFATSNAKVQNARFMIGQYQLMRKNALGSFAQMLREMSTDPAMLIWLDGRDSKKGNPNENYGRELMELFSLGIGHYTENDVREAARAFTGWEIKGTEAAFNAGQHDDGQKTVLSQTGNWKPDDIVRICLEQPSAPTFIVGKLFRFLVSESIPATPELIQPLADQFHKSNYDFGALVKTVLSSNLFYSADAYRSRIKPPVDFALGIVRGLEGHVGTSALAPVLEELGQNVFNPPSVKGWDGGQAWLNGQTLLFRQNLALALTSTEDVRFGARTDPAALARKHGKKSDEEVLDFFLTVFLQNDLPADSRSRLQEYQQRAHKQAAPVYWSEDEAADHRTRALCRLVLTLPEYQLS
jgi:uncharacterized protein (DUF1800 family)